MNGKLLLRAATKKLSRQIRRAFNILIKIDESLDLTYLSRNYPRDGVGTLPGPQCGTAGCQGFIGPYPSAFLDKQSIKELQQR